MRHVSPAARGVSSEPCASSVGRLRAHANAGVDPARRLRGAAVLFALGVVRLEALVRLAARCFGAGDAEEIVGVVAGGLLAATRASATARAAAVGGLIGPPVHDTL